MLKKVIWSFIVFSQLAYHSLGCDNSRLDAAAEMFSNKIANLHTPIQEFITRDKILSNLNFLRREAEMQPLYKAEDFRELFGTTTEKLKQKERFMVFASLCKELYDESNSRNQISIHMLYEEVYKKCQDYFGWQQIHFPHVSKADLEQDVYDFANIDRSNTDRGKVRSTSDSAVVSH